MVAVARNRGELVNEIRRFIKEPDENDTGFDTQEIIDHLNRAVRFREMQLYNTGENYGLALHDINLVADQPYYEVPTQGARIRRVLRYISADDRYVPLEREELHIQESFGSTTSSSADEYVPTYRVLSNSIALSPPPPSNITNGLRIELEETGDRLLNNNDTLPDEFPFYVEDLLVYDTVVALYAAEGTLSNESQDSDFASLERLAAKYEIEWQRYIMNRVNSPTFVSGWSLLDH